MHRYYVHVLHSLLEHQSTYRIYQIRHPLPPYLTHYAVLLALFHLLPYDLAEKLFCCLLVVCLAYGVRMCARQAGVMGEWSSLLLAPLLLVWPLMMGFFNFFLGIGLMFFCAAWWQKVRRGETRALAALLLLVLVLALTHPIPLLLLIVLSALDLAALLFFPDGRLFAARLRGSLGCVVALVLMLAAAAFPALAVDTTKTQSTLSLIGFHADYFRTSLLLSGVSPYNTRASDLWINLYRLTLYAILILALWLGARNLLAAFRARRLPYASIFFLATVALLVLLPFTPNEVNGSEYFTTRLVFVLWPAALIGASAGSPPSADQRRRWIVAGAFACLLTLIPAQIFIRPMAWRLRQVEMQPLPAHATGLLLLGPDIDGYARFHDQLGFDPMKWGAVLSVVHANDVILDSPWADLKITPIEAAPGSPGLLADISYAPIRRPPNPDAPAAPGRSLPAGAEARLAAQSAFVFLSASPPVLARGLSTQFSPAEAARFACQPSHQWYQLCIARQPGR